MAKKKTGTKVAKVKAFEGKYFATATSKDKAETQAIVAQRKEGDIVLATPKRSSFKAIERADLIIEHRDYNNRSRGVRITPRSPRISR